MSTESKNYWMAPGETPVDPQAARKEFVSDPRDERPDAGEFSRREFLKLMGIASVLAGSAACARRPVEKIIPYINKPEEATLGVPLWYASVAHDSFGEYGVLVKTREGRPIKLEGNPEHPVTQGGLTAQGQAAVWDLYDPDRLQQPLWRERRKGDGTLMELGEIDAKIRGTLRTASAKRGAVRLYTRPVSGHASRKMVQTFVAAFSAGAPVTAWPQYTDEILHGRALAFNDFALPQYRFDKASYVLSLGADFLGTWGNPVAQTKAWSSLRKLSGSNAAMSRLVCFEPLLTLTGTNADERYAVRSADLLKVALGVAHELLVVRLGGKFVENDALAPYALDKVAPQVGVPVEVLRRVASELWAARGKSLIVAGTATGEIGVALQGVVNLLNAALENEGETIDASARPWQADATAGTAELIANMQSGAVDVLVIAGANPVYELPQAAGFVDALAKVGTVIHLTDRVNETSQYADAVLPLSHFLESWGDAELTAGIHSIIQPTIQPLYQSRSLPATLLAWADNAAASVPGDAAWHEQLRADWHKDIYSKSGTPVAFDDFWNGALQSGVVTLPAGRGGPLAVQVGAVWSIVEPLQAQLAKNAQELEIVCYPTIALGDGRSANASWLQELPDPVTKITWDNYACVAPRTAKALGFDEGQVIVLRVGDAQYRLPVHIQPGTHDGVVAVPLGYGRMHGRVANGVGVRIHDAATVTNGRVSWTATVQTVQPTDDTVTLACVQGHQRIEGRQILQETTLAAYRDNPAAGAFPSHHGGEHGAHGGTPSMWGAAHEYTGYRWAMAVDLNACTGCGACMLACMVENNIPAVGKSQVLKGREMHWLRIDRYYAGDENSPTVMHQPMMCQHCEKAPCETVCPVLATVHDADGLNVQVYNRCVGTRYCSNNCPYKVRRFNWFDYGNSKRADDYAWTAPLHLMLNPDVTVREKGVMEKCTFCIQRLRSAKEDSKMRGETVRDGEAKTACQQSCPANAIVFGNVNDPDSIIAAVRKNPRGFSVLGELNILPQVTYLTKVRNTVVV